MESADISPHHLDAENLKQEVAADRQPQELPVRYIVPRPVPSVRSSPHTVASRYYERSPMFLQEAVGGHCRQMTIVSMHFFML